MNAQIMETTNAIKIKSEVLANISGIFAYHKISVIYLPKGKASIIHIPAPMRQMIKQTKSVSEQYI